MPTDTDQAKYGSGEEDSASGRYNLRSRSRKGSSTSNASSAAASGDEGPSRGSARRRPNASGAKASSSKSATSDYVAPEAAAPAQPSQTSSKPTVPTVRVTPPVEEHSMVFTASMRPHFDQIAFGYAVMVLVGGIIGYVQAKSTISLVMGVCFGICLLAAATVVSRDPHRPYAMLILGAILAGVMGVRFVKTGAFFPAGWVAFNSGMIVMRYSERALYLRQQAAVAERAERNKRVGANDRTK